jgi:hypothetical protein
MAAADMVIEAWGRHFGEDWTELMIRIKNWSESAEKHRFAVNRFYPSVVVREYVNDDVFGYLATVNVHTGSRQQMTLSAARSLAEQNTLDTPSIDSDVLILDQETGDVVEARRGDGETVAFYTKDVQELFVQIAQAVNLASEFPLLIKFAHKKDGTIVILETGPILLPGGLKDIAVRSTLTGEVIQRTPEGIKIIVRFESDLDLNTTDITDPDKITNPVRIMISSHSIRSRHFHYPSTEMS